MNRTANLLALSALYFVTIGCERTFVDSQNSLGPAVEPVSAVKDLARDDQLYRVMNLDQLFEGDSVAQRKLQEISATNVSRTDLDASDYERALNHWAKQGWRLVAINKSNYWIFEKSQITQSAPDSDSSEFACSEETWLGEWGTNWGTLKLRHNFTESGNISGVYGSEQHTIHGKLDPENPRVFSGLWLHSDSSNVGRFRFVMHQPNKFEGAWTWNHDDPSLSTTNWTGEKQKDAPAKEASEEL